MVNTENNKVYANIYYFKRILALGGTEQFLYEIAKKYKDYDILILYDYCDKKQYERISKFVRCKQRKPGEKVYCKRAFFNFNLDAIDDVISTENYYCFVSHAIYQELGYQPPVNHPKLTHFIGVSNYAVAKLEEFGRKINKPLKAELCYDPLTLEPQKRTKHLISACRLSDKTKGGDRTKKLIAALDKHCEQYPDDRYDWLIFTGEQTPVIKSPNVTFMKPTLEVRRFIAAADFVLQLSNDMETFCYTTNEAWGYGVHTITTPFSVNKELPIPPEANFELDWDCGNIDAVVNHIFNDELKPFTYTPPEDQWLDFLVNEPSSYQKELHTYVEVEATGAYEEEHRTDKELGYKPKRGERWVCTLKRANELISDNELNIPFVKIIKEVEKN